MQVRVKTTIGSVHDPNVDDRPADGELLLKTDKTGPAAKTGHRLTIGFNDWTGSVDVDDTAAEGFAGGRRRLHGGARRVGGLTR